MILVTGSTGNIGRPLVQLLAEAGQRVRAVVLPGEAAPWADELGVEVIAADFDDPSSLAAAAAAVDRVFMLTPPSARQEIWQRNIIDACRDSRSVDYVVKLSAFASGPESPLTMGRWHYSGELELARSAVPHSIIRPQYFVQNLLAGPTITTTGVMPTFIASGTPVGAVDVGDVAAVAAALLTAGSPAQDGEILVPTGPRAVTTDDVAEELARALGRPVTVDYLLPDRGREVMRARGLPEWHLEDVLTICTTASPLITDCVPQLTGRPARDIAAVADDFAARRTAGPLTSP